MKGSYYYVYAIKSDVDDRIYVGISENPERRLTEHNNSRTKSTKGYKPWKLIYKEELSSRSEARRREVYLKSGCGKEFLKNLAP